MCKKVGRKPMSNEDFIKGIDINKFKTLEPYINMATPIKTKCLVCGNIWSPLPYNLKRSDNCPDCKRKNLYNSRRLTNEQFLYRVKNIYGDEYDVLTKYFNTRTKVKIRHNACGNIYEIRPNDFINAKRKCRYCQGLIKTHEDFVKEVYELVKNEYTVLGTYKNALTKIKMKHNKCGSIYYTRPSNFTSANARCPKCLESRGEKKIEKWLIDNNIRYKVQQTFDDLVGFRNKKMPYDFAILGPRGGIKYLIEYDGGFHTNITNLGNDLLAQLNRDRIKSDYAKKKRIKLIRITENQFDNIESILENELLVNQKNVKENK